MIIKIFEIIAVAIAKRCRRMNKATKKAYLLLFTLYSVVIVIHLIKSMFHVKREFQKIGEYTFFNLFAINCKIALNCESEMYFCCLLFFEASLYLDNWIKNKMCVGFCWIEIGMTHFCFSSVVNISILRIDHSPLIILFFPLTIWFLISHPPRFCYFAFCNAKYILIFFG